MISWIKCLTFSIYIVFSCSILHPDDMQLELVNNAVTGLEKVVSPLQKHSDTEVLVTVYSDNLKANYQLLKIETDAKLREIVTLKEKEGNGIMIISNNEKNLSLKWNKPKSYNEAMKLFRSEKWESVVNLLRPHIYPSVRFLKVARTDFHIPVTNYLKALVGLKQWYEAVDLLCAISPEKLVSVYVSLSLKVFEEILPLGKINQVLVLANHINKSKNSSLQMKIANQLREHGYFAEASLMCQRISQAIDFSYAKESRLWFYYCELKQGNSPLIKDQIHALKSTDRTRREYPLGLFLKGHIAVLEEQYEKVILFFSKGIVYSNLQQSWISELMHTTAIIYEELGKSNAAKNIHRQVILFFKDSIWGRKSQMKLQEGGDENLTVMNCGHFLILALGVSLQSLQKILLPKIFP